MNRWTLYDHLISRVAEDDALERVQFGDSWTMVKTQRGLTGVAATYTSHMPPHDARGYIGMPLKQAAAFVKSWDFREAALGLATINASVNRRERFGSQENPDAFLRFRDRCEGGKVAVIGRFAYLEKRLEGLCDMYVLERAPSGDDYPDPACEYLLPDMDVIFITGSTVQNKTMPRLLELSKDAFTIISGPSAPMDDVLFQMGADALCGFCVTKPDVCERAVTNCAGIFASGDMVCVEKGDR